MQYHIRKLSLFGSAAWGELRPDSDIDLLVEFEPGKAPSLVVRSGFAGCVLSPVWGTKC